MGIVSRMNTLRKLITDPQFRFSFLAGLGLKKNVPGEELLGRIYQYKMNRPLDLDHPVLYTEKLQWLKLYDHRPEYTVMVDKYAVKDYVAEKIGPQYVIPMLHVWDRAEDIDFDTLPDRFVLKTTHDSGSLVICRDKNRLNIPQARKKLKKALKRDYYECTREWPYKNVRPRIIAEKYMEDTRQGELRDYKFFTFGGVPKVLYIAQGRGLGGETTADFFDMDFHHLPFTIDHETSPVTPEKPRNFELMKELAARLSAGTPQLRVDFYEVDGQVYFGEMTFFHCRGLEPFHPEQWDRQFGDWTVLPEKTRDLL